VVYAAGWEGTGTVLGEPSPGVKSGSLDGIHRAGFDAGPAIDAGIGINDADVALFADGVDWAAGLASPTIDARFGNGMSQGNHLLFGES